MSNHKRQDDDWNEYKHRDNRKLNRPNRESRSKKHSHDETDSPEYINSQIYR